MKRKIIPTILIVLIVFITVFIFSNSFKGHKKTMNDSGIVAEILTPVMKDVVDTENENFENSIRKLAHLFEFSILGTAIAVLLYFVKKFYSKTFFGFALFYIMFVGLTDEFIQMFFERSSSVSDVLIDFSGGLFGLLLTLSIIKIFNYISKKIKFLECKNLGRKKV